MHEVQRIFYMHVGTWSAMYTALGVAFVANVAWLRTRNMKWDWLGVSAVEVTVVRARRADHAACFGASRRGEFGGRGMRA